MTEPRRWLDGDAPDGVRELLAAARGEEPGRAGTERTLVALGVASAVVGGSAQAAAAGAAASAAAVKSATSLGTLALVTKWGLVGALSAVTTFGAVHVVTSLAAPPASGATGSGRASGAGGPSRPASGRVAAARAEARAVPVDPAGVAPGVAPQPELPPAGGASKAGTGPALGAGVVAAGPAVPPGASVVAAEPAPGSAPEESPRMLEEVAAIDRARGALARGDARATLRALDAYDAQFPERRFAPEALYLKMEALGRLGDDAGRRAAAARLLATFPSAPQAARARMVLEAAAR